MSSEQGQGKNKQMFVVDNKTDEDIFLVNDYHVLTLLVIALIDHTFTRFYASQLNQHFILLYQPFVLRSQCSGRKNSEKTTSERTSRCVFHSEILYVNDTYG